MQEMDEEYRRLIESYLPGWQYDPRSGQSEAALVYAAWHLLEENRRRMAELPEKHEREFLNAWPLEPMQAQPMQTYAVLRAPEGERIPSGSEVYLSGSGTRLWKTVHSASAEAMTLTAQILESAELGKLIDPSLPTEAVPFRLYDFRHRGGQRNAVRFTHPDAFRTRQGGSASLLLPECDPALLSRLADPEKTRWTLGRPDGSEISLNSPVLKESTLKFSLPADASADALVAEFEPGAPVPTQTMGRVSVSAERNLQSGLRVLTDQETVQTAAFEPFGQSPELWRCCYLAAPDVLGLRGGEVQVEFFLNLFATEEKLPTPEQKPKYRSIMLHMPPPPPPIREVRAQNVVWEYWNGSAWLPVPGTAQETELFASGEALRSVQLRFRWPEDACACEVQGQEEIWLRWRITRADGMGYLPRRVYTPQVSNLQLQSSLTASPVELSVCTGLNPDFIPLAQSRTTRLFSYAVSQEDGWWLCFDRAPRGQNVQFYLAFAGRNPGSALTLWESTRKGLQPRSFFDGTDGLAHSGIISAADLDGDLTELFGRRGWWICFRDSGNRIRRSGVYPNMTGLCAGAVCLQAEQNDSCLPEETVRPLRGGAVSGCTLTAGFGGAEPESDRELLLRAEKVRHHRNRGVSALDIQQLVQSAFRDVVRTRCHRDGSAMEIAVLMRDVHQHSAAFGRRREEISRLIAEKTVLATTGLKIRVREPNFYPVQAAVWLETDGDSDFQTDREQVQQALRQFLNPVSGKFRGDGWFIGDLPTEQELSNDLMQQLPGMKVLKVLLTVITPLGAEIECDRVRDPFALPVAGKIAVREVKREEIG